MRWHHLLGFVAIILLVGVIGTVSAATVNSYNASLVYLVQGNYTSTATAFTDSSPYAKAITTNGAAVINTTTAKLGNGNLFNNGVNGYLSTPDSADFWFQNLTTIMFWVYPTSTSQMVPFGQYQDANNYNYVALNPGGSTSLVSVKAGTTVFRIDASAANIPTNAWTQVAILTSAGTSKIYINGVDKTTGVPVTTGYADITGTFNIGYLGSGTNYQSGNIDTFAIWKGVLVSSSDLYPMTSEFGVYSPPGPVTNFTASSQTVPLGTTVSFTDASTGAALTSFNYTATDVAGVQSPFQIATTASTSYAFTNPGVWRVDHWSSNATTSVMAAPGLIVNSGRRDANILLLHMNGANGGTNFIDGSYYNNTLFAPNMTTSTTQTKLGATTGFFNGVNGYVDVPNSPTTQLGQQFTVSAWVFPSTITGTHYVVARNQSMAIGMVGAVPKAYLSSTGASSWDIVNGANFAAALPVNQWSQLVLTKNATFVDLYCNGTLGSSTATTGTVYADPSDIIVGGSSTNNAVTFKGWMDEVAIWNNVALPISFAYPQSSEFNASAFTPSASFSQNQTSGVEPLVVQFTDTSIGGPTEWSWVEVNNTASNSATFATTQNPLYTFNQVASWTINMTTSNTYGAYSSLPSTVSTGAPVAAFAFSPISGSAALLVNFTPTGYDGVPTGLVYNWSFGDGQYSNTVGAVSHVYAFNGMFTPSLWVNSTGGNSSATAGMITVSSTQNTQNTWYTQRLVKIKIVDAYGSPIPNANLSLTYVASTLPSTNTSWLVDAFGITADVAAQMTNGGLAMQGGTSNDGSLTFMLFPALTYGMTITNATIGLNNYQTITPSDTDYTVFCPLPYQNVNSQVYGKMTQLAQNLLYVSQINATAVMINFQYQDSASATTAVTWNVTNWNTGAVVYGRTFGNPGIGMIIDNYTVLTVPSGVDYRFAYEATRNTP